MLRARGIAKFILTCAHEVLHSDGPREIEFQCVIDITAGQLFEDRSCSVEIPVVVEKVGAGPLRPATRRARRIIASVGGFVVDTGASREKMLDCSVQFLVLQALNVS